MVANKQALTGSRIVVTGTTTSGGRLAARLRSEGAEVLELPLVRVVPDLDVAAAEDAFGEIGSYEWLVFTSANGVHHFFEAFFERFEDIRALGLMRIAVIGEGTGEAVRSFRLKIDVTPPRAVAEDLAAALKETQTLDNIRILVVTGNRNRDVLVNSLTEERAIVDSLRVYRTDFVGLEGNSVAAAFREKGADALVFASSSAVNAFGEQASHLKLGPGAKVPLLCSFGPITSMQMRAMKIPVAVEAALPGIDGMVEALVARLGT